MVNLFRLGLIPILLLITLTPRWGFASNSDFIQGDLSLLDQKLKTALSQILLEHFETTGEQVGLRVEGHIPDLQERSLEAFRQFEVNDVAQEASRILLVVSVKDEEAILQVG